MRFRFPALLAGVALIAAGCSSEPTAPDDRSEAADAAQTLTHLADSLSSNGGSASEVGAYRGLAALLEGTGRLSTVTISVDGAPSEFLATAQEIAFGCPPEMLCSMVAVPPDRFLSAWQKDNPRRMVQLFVPGVAPSTVTYFSSDASVAAVPDLLFLDGNGALYGGATTSRSITSSVSDTPCVTRDGTQTAQGVWPCRQADFTVAFDGAVDGIPLESPLAPPADSSGAHVTQSTGVVAAPSHRVTMSSQQVHGAHVDLQLRCVSCADPGQPGTTPPIPSPWRDSLTASLTATVGSDVTFTFTVTNASDSTKTVRFNDSQQYDIRVWDANNTLVWRWGAEKAFAQIVTTRVLAPGESATYVEHWTPPSPGSYHAMAYLTSSTHGAAGFTDVNVP